MNQHAAAARACIAQVNEVSQCMRVCMQCVCAPWSGSSRICVCKMHARVSCGCKNMGMRRRHAKECKAGAVGLVRGPSVGSVGAKPSHDVPVLKEFMELHAVLFTTDTADRARVKADVWFACKLVMCRCVRR